MTISEIKDQLPNVKIKIEGKILTGRLSGRKNQFATVRAGNYEASYSWHAVERAINNDKSLIF